MRATAVFLTLSLMALEAQAGPWGRDKGSIYFNVSYEFLRTTQLATPDGIVREVPQFQLQQVGVYTEYGLSDAISLIVDRIGARSSSFADFESASGFEDVRLGAQWRLPSSGPFVFAARAIVQAPTGDVDKGLGLLPTGTGAWEADLRFSLGRSSASGRIYAYGEFGNWARGNGLRDAFIYETQVGVRAARRVWIQFGLRGVEPYSSTPGESALSSPAGLGDGVTYTAYGPSLVVEIGDDWGIQWDHEDAFHAKNLAVGPKMRFKVFFER